MNEPLAYDVRVRALRYRLRSQGMVELDAWLSPLLQATKQRDEGVLQAVEYLLACEPPTLLAMQSGKLEIPHELVPWLS